MAKIKLIEHYHKKNLKCRFCGETRSVKYEAKLITAQNLDGEKIHVCNACALVYSANFV